MEADHLSFQESELGNPKNKMYNLPKLNVVRRINFDDVEKNDKNPEQVPKNTKKKSPRRESDRIRFLQSLKQEVSNAKIAARRPVTRSAVKKSYEERSKSLDVKAVNERRRNSTGYEKIVESEAPSGSKTKKNSFDGNEQTVKLQGNIDCKPPVNCDPTVKQNETLQFCILNAEKTPAKPIIQPQSYNDLNDNVDLTDAPFCIDLQEEIDNEPVLQDKEFTDYVYQQFQQMESGQNLVETEQPIITEEKGYCSSGGGSFEKSQIHVQVVEAMVHTHETTTNLMEQVTNISQPLQLNNSESVLSTLKLNDSEITVYSDGHSPKKSVTALPFLKNDSQQNVTLLRHSNTLDYQGLLCLSDETTQLTNLDHTTPIEDTVTTANVFELQPTSTVMTSISCPDPEYTDLKKSTSQDFLNVISIDDDIDNTSQSTNKNAARLESSSTDIIQQPILQLSQEEKFGKVMKKKDFFNKENKNPLKFPVTKQVTVVESLVYPPNDCTNSLLPNRLAHEKHSVKIKEKQREVLSALQEVQLDSIIAVKQKPNRKKKLTSNVNKKHAFKEISTDNFQNVEYSVHNEMCDGTKHAPMTRNRTKQQQVNTKKLGKKLTSPIPISTTSTKETIKEVKHEKESTRKRKKNTRQNEIDILEIDNDEITEITNKSPVADTVNLKKQDINETPLEDNIDVNKTLKDFDTVQKDEQIKSLRKKDSRKSYVDFLSEDEDFVWSSSSWAGSGSSESDTGTDTKSKTIRKKKKPNKNETDCENMLNVEPTLLDLRVKKKRTNKSINRKIAREKGDTYISRKGATVAGKYMKDNPCSADNCHNGCYTITEERRRNLFHHYWSLDNTRKRDWLVSNANRESVKRKRTKDFSRRTGTFKYYINEGEGKREVCLKFILKTLDIRQKFLYNTLSNSHLGSSKDDLRGNHSPPNKTPKEVVDSLKMYLKNLPVLPSHYCRKSSSKLYLPAEFKNLSNLYRIYKETQSLEGKPIVSEKLFRTTFKKDFDYGFHVPRKDKCIQCLKYENNKCPEMEEVQKSHLKDKEETYQRFKMHQNIHLKDSSILCVSFDLQKVLNTPFGKSILLYYYRKLCVYNFTFYECGTREGHCYTWSEVDGKRGANEICSILKLYVQKIDDMGTVKHLLFYSDCCPGQNRNKIVISCIQKLLQQSKNLETIQLNYLLPGHTYMPVDSMHSVIEKSVKNTNVWTPTQWAMVFGLARKSPKPYNVQVLTHKDFMDWDSLVQKDYQKLLGKISKLRIVTFKKSAPQTLYIKYSMHPEAKTETIDIPIKGRQIELKRAYKTKLPISKKKQDDFIKMCSCAIPEAYHSHFLNLCTSNNVEDNLQDTDVED